MENSRFTNIYKMLKDNNFNMENTISSEILCAICNKILINAQSGPCGCRYCLECITAYLDGKAKCCPGNMDDCKIDLLNINNNIHIDQPMNIKISKLIVKCPERQCNEKIELRKVEDHIKICNWRPTNCPFFNVGCRNVQMSNDKMEQHILSEKHEHTKLLMDCIDDLRSEVGQMKEKMRDMREEVEGKQIVIDELRAVIAQQSRDINNLSTKIESYEAETLEMRNNGENQMNEMAQMNDKLELKATDVDVKIGGLEERLISIQSAQLNYGEFVWPIENFADKRRKAQNGIETEILSEAFFSHKNGYKMCLSVWPDGESYGVGTHLCAGFCLMRGPFDDILQWPFVYDVAIDIINRQSPLNNYRQIVKHDPSDKDWDRPITDRNFINGFYNFIEFDELLNNIELYNNDRIFIKCTVQIS